MGIVAYCPNDHRVKVKDNLAGKKGICPTCGARFRIPLESQPDRKHGAPDDAELAADFLEPLLAAAPVLTPVSTPPPAPASARLSSTGIPVADIVSLDATVAASLPRALPLATPR